jgi:hypothetical protein
MRYGGHYPVFPPDTICALPRLGGFARKAIAQVIF